MRSPMPCTRTISVRAGDLLCAGIVAYVTQGRNELVQDWLAGLQP